MTEIQYPLPRPTHAGELKDSVIHYMKIHAAHVPDKIAYRYLKDGENVGSEVSYGALYDQSHKIACHLSQIAKPGDRAMLLYPPGTDFVTAFYGCLMAGVIAVPLYPPTGQRRLSRLETVAKNCEARIIMSIKEVKGIAVPWFSQNVHLKDLNWLTTDDLPEATPEADLPELKADAVAFLQYTSGSTSLPKGVEITHANIVHNVFLISECIDWVYNCVGWLPIYHDMGLIGNMIITIFTGGEHTFMSPIDFIRKPARWLRAVSKYGGVGNSAPNFAFDLCVSEIKDEELEGVDLSTWQITCNGSEPIKSKTIRNFHERFAKFGMRHDLILPCYGMAETTLIVSGKKGEIHNAHLDIEALQQGKIKLSEKPTDHTRELPSSGPVHKDMRLIIVNPETCVEAAPDEIGEVWIQGPSVAKGYWKRPDLNATDFEAKLKDASGKVKEEDGHFLRTGDLGFKIGSLLYITGRIKEILIINGANHYPQDIELSLQQSAPELQENAGAAFAVAPDEGSERLVVFQEISRRYVNDFDAEELIGKIRDAVYKAHEIAVEAVFLITPGRVPKTTSGKIQRVLCKRMFEKGDVPDTMATWVSPSLKAKMAPPKPKEPASAPAMPGISAKFIEQAIMAEIAKAMSIPMGDVDPETSFARLGLTPEHGVELSKTLKKFTGLSIDPTDLYNYTTVRNLAAYIQSSLSGKL